ISSVFPDSRTVVRTRPLEALIIGGYVRGLSDRDIESLMQEAGLGQVSKSTASRICRELRDRYKAFCARSLAEVNLLALYLDANLPADAAERREGGCASGLGLHRVTTSFRELRERSSSRLRPRRLERLHRHAARPEARSGRRGPFRSQVVPPLAGLRRSTAAVPFRGDALPRHMGPLCGACRTTRWRACQPGGQLP